MSFCIQIIEKLQRWNNIVIYKLESYYNLSKIDFIYAYNWLVVCNRCWNPIFFYKKKILLIIKSDVLSFFLFSNIYLFTVCCFTLLIFKKNHHKKIVTTIFSWVFALSWVVCIGLTISENQTSNSLEFLNWINGILYISFFILGNANYQYQKNFKSKTPPVTTIHFVMLTIVLYGQLYLSIILLKIIFIELFLITTCSCFLNIKKKKKFFISFVNSDILWTRKVMYFLLLWLEFLNFFNATAPYQLTILVSFSILCTFVEWFLYIRNICYRSKTRKGFFTLILTSLTLHVNMLSLIELGVTESTTNINIILCFFGLYFFSKQTVAVPFKAKERFRKITMFAPAPIMPDKKTFFPQTSYNSNSNFLTLNFICVFYLTLHIIGICLPHKGIIFFVVNFWTLVTLLCMHYTAVQMYIAIKSYSVLDWKGIFLVIPQHNWIIKTTNACLFFLILLFVFLLSKLFIDLLNSKLNIVFLIIFFLFFVYFFLNIGLLFVFWNSIITYKQPASQEFWTKEFWMLMSPHLRDFLYWLPIRPDDYVAPLPFYAGFRYRRSIYKFLWVCFFFIVYFSLVFNLINSNCLYINIFNIYHLFLLLVCYTSYTLYRSQVAADNSHLRDYVYFETQIYLLCLFVSFFCFWFCWRFTKYWVLWVLLYWIISF